LKFPGFGSIIIGVSERNKQIMKKESSNKLVCQITGSTRISNKEYLANKAQKYGITVVEFKAFYVSKNAVKGLRAEVEQNGVVGAAASHNRTEEDIRKMVSYNGSIMFLTRLREKRDKALKARLQQEKKAQPTAPKVESTSDHDRKLARRRELYAQKKRQELIAA